MEVEVERVSELELPKECHSLLSNFLCYGLNLSHSVFKLKFLIPAVTWIQTKHDENIETNIRYRNTIT